ncbi:MAG: hypothetical protein GXP08_14940 [Gammaproteobacteria bacterium]|nr:hypothetical protein [Gammaproteobacteria bacterium]
MNGRSLEDETIPAQSIQLYFFTDSDSNTAACPAGGHRHKQKQFFKIKAPYRVIEKNAKR